MEGHPLLLHVPSSFVSASNNISIGLPPVRMVGGDVGTTAGWTLDEHRAANRL